MTDSIATSSLHHVSFPLARTCSTMAPKRRVTFDPKLNVFLVDHSSCRSSSSSDDSRSSKCKRMWYTRKELKRMRWELRCSLKNVSLSGTDWDGEAFPWRGLEHIQAGTMGSTVENRQILIQSVISLQKLHKKMGLRDDRGLSVFASAYNQQAARRAHDIAKQDSDEARQIYNEVEETTTDSDSSGESLLEST